MKFAVKNVIRSHRILEISIDTFIEISTEISIDISIDIMIKLMG